MALLGRVESRSLRGRLFHGAIIVVLALGGLTMVYPFAIMLSGSIRSEMDQADLDLVPGFWVNQTALYRKFLEVKYNQDVELLNRAHLTHNFSFRGVSEPELIDDAEVDRLETYLTRPDLPLHWQSLGGIAGMRQVPDRLRELRQRLAHRYGGDREVLSQELGSPVSSWQLVVIVPPDWASERYDFQPNPLFETYFAMLAEAPAAERVPVSLTGHFLQSVIYPNYGRAGVAAYNAAHTVKLERFDDLRLSATAPGVDQPQLRQEWIDYVTQILSPSFIVLAGVPQSAYDAFVDQAVGPSRRNPLPDGRTWLHGAERDLYRAFLNQQPIERYRLVGPEFEFGQDTMARATAGMEHRHAVSHAASLRWSYSIRNYVNVFDELVLQGRALINTVVFCALAIVLALVINPVAAYALSQYKLPGTYKIMLFLMATIAFPPMVTLIPQFVLLRNLGLLNTFAALVLPLAVNGYMIFLLKGFFDTLPRELYEAARIDGASEMRMFWQITMLLSKPILAVLALGTFVAAYMMFLYPLLVAPSPDMWLISVWLYQYQQRASNGGVYASIVLASIPTLVIFLFTQRTIMRGIVVPTEK